MPSDTPHQQPGLITLTRELCRESVTAVRAGGFRLIGLMLAFHLLALLLAFPVLGWLFREALRTAGMPVLDLTSIDLSSGVTVTLTLIVVTFLVALWLMALQFATVIIVLRRSRAGLAITPKNVLRDLGAVARKLARPSSFPLLGYLFFLIPLSGFGFTSILAQGIAIPSFITGELYKSPATATGLLVFFALLIFLNLRFALAIPAFTLTTATGWRAFRISWRLTRSRATWSLITTVLLLLLLISLAAVALVAVALLPTVLSDLIAPAASPIIAASSLGIAQVLGAVIGAVATSLLGALLIAFFDHQAHRLPKNTVERPLSQLTPKAVASDRQIATTVITAAALVAIVLSSLGVGTMQRLATQPETLILGHRGFSDGGVENTLSGLDAARVAGADMVEMDVMQTADGKFVAMHDASLSRLAGQDLLVKDLTFDEITGIAVSNTAGFTDVIPSFAEYVLYAEEIGMPLLIEIKLNGGETPDHVALLLAELDELGVTEQNFYHSLDRASVEELKRLRPDLTVGFTMAFGGFGAPDIDADFIVVEEWTATQKLQDQATAAGYGFMSWTVDDEAGMRELLRRDVMGIITDYPNLAVKYREEMTQSSGLSSILFDALIRFVKIA